MPAWPKSAGRVGKESTREDSNVPMPCCFPTRALGLGFMASPSAVMRLREHDSGEDLDAEEADVLANGRCGKDGEYITSAGAKGGGGLPCPGG